MAHPQAAGSSKSVLMFVVDVNISLWNLLPLAGDSLLAGQDTLNHAALPAHFLRNIAAHHGELEIFFPQWKKFCQPHSQKRKSESHFWAIISWGMLKNPQMSLSVLLHFWQYFFFIFIRTHTHMYKELSQPYFYLIVCFPGIKHLTCSSLESDRFFSTFFPHLLLRSYFSHFLCLSQLIWTHSYLILLFLLKILWVFFSLASALFW